MPACCATPTELRGHGFAQVVVTRAARRLSAADLDGRGEDRRCRNATASMPGPYSLSIDGGAPAIVVEPELTGEIASPGAEL